MEIPQTHKKFSPLVAGCSILVVLLILGGLVTSVSFKLRKEIRKQIINRDAQVLYPVVLKELADLIEEEIIDDLFDGEIELLPVVLETSELKGVIAARIFNPLGNLESAIPKTFVNGVIRPSDMNKLNALNPVSHYYPNAALDFFITKLSNPETIPLLEVILPLHASHSDEVLGFAHYLIDGRDIKREFEELDHNITQQAGIAFGTAAIIIILILSGTFRWLYKSNQLLYERSQSLMSANEELILATKTSAIGTLTAHLLHDLKNPLAGIQDFVSDLDLYEGEEALNIRQMAIGATHRMQSMIQDVSGMLHDEENNNAFEYSIEEIKELITNRAQKMADKKDIKYSSNNAPTENLVNRKANLLLLILINLHQNAFDASPIGSEVNLEFEKSDDILNIRVSDQGDGLPEYFVENLFKPCKSEKKGGSGIGLAISYQLAKHIDANLSLEKNSRHGACFLLSIKI